MRMNQKNMNKKVLTAPLSHTGWVLREFHKITKKMEDILYKVKLSFSVLVKGSLLSVDYHKWNSKNQFKDIQLQLHASSLVSNPYTFNIQGNKRFSAPEIRVEHYAITARGSQPWYEDTNWPDVSKVSDLTIDGSNTEAKFNVWNVTDTSFMFFNCANLTSLDFDGFDTSSVTNMKRMFTMCEKLTSLNIMDFDTSSVTNMQEMFALCKGLTSLFLGNIDTSNVTNMEGMFMGCNTLESFDVGGLDTSNVTNMYEMFSTCTRIKSLDLHNFNTSNVTNMQEMFQYCVQLKSLDLRNFDTSSVTNMNNMFFSCGDLETLHYSLTGFTTNGVAPDLSTCSQLKTLYLYNAPSAYVNDFTTKAKVPSTCSVIIAS